MTPKQLTMGQEKRIAVERNIPIACNRASADFIISSPLMADEYERLIWAEGHRDWTATVGTGFRWRHL